VASLRKSLDNSNSVPIQNQIIDHQKNQLQDLQMPLKIIHPRHTEVMGTGLVLISSPPVIGPKGDLNARQIAAVSYTHLTLPTICSV